MSESADVGAVTARAVHGPGLLARVATVANPYDVTGLDYRVAADGVATATLTVAGGPWQVERVAARLRRVVGVTAVVVALAPPQSGSRREALAR